MYSQLLKRPLRKSKQKQTLLRDLLWDDGAYSSERVTQQSRRIYCGGFLKQNRLPAATITNTDPDSVICKMLVGNGLRAVPLAN
jgi:hypothetical protein